MSGVRRYGAYKRALVPVDEGYPYELEVVTLTDHSSALSAVEKERNDALVTADRLGEGLMSVKTERDALRARVVEMERDAARYRYVRTRTTGASVADGRHTMTIEFPVGILLWMNPDGFDITVDAALSNEKREEQK